MRTSVVPLSLLNLAFALEGYMDKEGELLALTDDDGEEDGDSEGVAAAASLERTRLRKWGEMMASRIEARCAHLLRVEGRSPLEPGQRVVFAQPAVRDFAVR